MEKYIQTFADYKNAITPMIVYPRATKIEALQYLALGLNGEAGEVADQIKKAMRNDDGEISVERLVKLRSELGDVLWYLTRLADELETNLAEVANENVEKLLARKEQGTLRHERG
ncbi:MAG: nucleoside triphosphate pyrophosphohydrolase family protein [Pyrinomonadaceae bacterium]